MVIKRIKQLAAIIGKFLLLLTFFILSIVLADSLTPVLQRQEKPIATFFFEFIPFLGLLFGHFFMVKFFEKSNLGFVRVSGRNAGKNIALGFAVGLMWVTASMLAIYVLGQGKLNDRFLLTVPQLLYYFLLLLINASMQELLVHGYLFSVLERTYSKLTALITTSILFLLLHPGAMQSGLVASINVFGAGLIFGLITMKFDSLVLATVAHTTWNYFGAVWFGQIPLDNYPSLQLISVTGDPLIVGDKNGMETSVVVTVIIFFVVAYFSILKQQVPRVWPKL